MSTTTAPDLGTLAGALRPTIGRLHQILRRRTAVTEYTAAQATALVTLLDHGPLRMGELADREGVRMPTATALVDGLSRQGLAERTPDPEDRRAVLVQLSAHGAEVLTDVAGRRDEVLVSALQQMSSDDIAALGRAVPALVELKHLLEANGRPESAATDSEN
ncbi:MarR family winged helix-turn-helix transcriptional regulator [Williamsia sterculiae]|nr:MarR family transcriptional regulator [Williamsia sterculiae]